MNKIAASITRWVNDGPQPGIVECKLTDRFGKDWAFVEKSAIVSSASLTGDSVYPQPGYIGCHIITIGTDDSGRSFAVVDTEQPWGIEAVDGATCFEVFADQLV
jgi:hypothetical protein